MFFAGPERSHPTTRRAGVGRRPEVPLPTTGTGTDRHRVRITVDAGAAARIRDRIELVIGDTVLVEAPLHASTKNIVQLLVLIFVHPDVFAGAQSAYKPVVDAAEQLLPLIRDADDGKLVGNYLCNYRFESKWSFPSCLQHP